MVDQLTIAHAWSVCETVMDPEIPVLSVVDLGIVRNITWSDGKEQSRLVVTITPTYSGCPAMDVISQLLKMELSVAGFDDVRIQQTLSPAWTTDWMTEAGKQKLKAYGIAPPNATASVCLPAAFAAEESVQCPHCGAWHTARISEFGSTACKSLYKCKGCEEVFDYFKCH